MKYYSFITFLLLLCTSCNQLKQINFSEHQAIDTTQNSDNLRIEFNGVASFYIQYKKSAVLTDPFLSNPSLSKVIFGKINSDQELINKFNPKTKYIKILSLSHSHYDHILDLPYFIPHLDDSTKIVGSRNSIILTKSLNIKQECIDIAAIKADTGKLGTWVYSADSTVRIMAIKSAHPPHILGILLYKGQYKSIPSSYPDKAKNFKQDETLAYLIDFLNSAHKPEKRIYFSSSSASFPYGYFPQKEIENKNKNIDVAIISLALFHKAENYPKQLIKYLKPTVTIPCHWENTFNTRNNKLKPVAMTSIKSYLAEIEDLKGITEFHFIKPGYSWKMK